MVARAMIMHRRQFLVGIAAAGLLTPEPRTFLGWRKGYQYPHMKEAEVLTWGPWEDGYTTCTWMPAIKRIVDDEGNLVFNANTIWFTPNNHFEFDSDGMVTVNHNPNMRFMRLMINRPTSLSYGVLTDRALNAVGVAPLTYKSLIEKKV